MTHAAPAPEDRLDIVRACLQVFAILFSELFEGPAWRFITRGMRNQASAFLCGVECLLRRVLLIEAAALAPALPPPSASRPAAARKRAVIAFDPARPETWRASFNAMKPQRLGQRAGGAPEPGAPAADLADIRPLARRYEAILRVLAAPDLSARRLAFRLRALKMKGETAELADAVRLHPDHQRFLERPLVLASADAGAALRGLFADSS